MQHALFSGMIRKYMSLKILAAEICVYVTQDLDYNVHSGFNVLVYTSTVELYLHLTLTDCLPHCNGTRALNS